MARGVIAIDEDMAHVILGALDVCRGEGINGIATIGPLKGPNSLAAILAAQRLVHAVASVCPEIAAAYGEPAAIDDDVSCWKKAIKDFR